MKIKQVSVNVPELAQNFIPDEICTYNGRFTLQGTPRRFNSVPFVKAVYAPNQAAQTTAVQQVIEGVIISTLNSMLYQVNKDADSKALISTAAKVVQLGSRKRVAVQYEEFIKDDHEIGDYSFIGVGLRYGHHKDYQKMFYQNAVGIEGEYFSTEA